MKLNCRHSIYLFLALLIISITCVGGENDNSRINEIKIKLESISKEIESLIGEAKCDNDNQCSYIEIGQKPCGGPAGHKIYSSKVTDTTKLLKASQEHIKLSNEFNMITGLASDCSVEVPPTVVCNNKCVSK